MVFSLKGSYQESIADEEIGMHNRWGGGNSITVFFFNFIFKFKFKVVGSPPTLAQRRFKRTSFGILRFFNCALSLGRRTYFATSE